jgi:hypothetical protein
MQIDVSLSGYRRLLTWRLVELTKIDNERCSHNSSRRTHSLTGRLPRLLSQISSTCAPNRSPSRSSISASNPPQACANTAMR